MHYSSSVANRLQEVSTITVVAQMLKQNHYRSDTMIKKLVRTRPMLFEKAADYVLVDCLLRQYRSSYKVISSFD